MKWLKSLRGTALFVSLCLAAPAAAQFEQTYPDEPPKEGQTLLEWSRPPILDYTIPPEQRDDVSSCGARHDLDLDETAVTCWPVLRAAQLFTLASFAQGEPTGDMAANQRQGVEYADQGLAFIGTPRWPLQEHLRSKLLEVKLSALVKLEDWDAALPVARDLVENVSGDLMKYDDFRRGFAHRRYGEVLLKLGRVKEARADFMTAWSLLNGPAGDKVGLPLSKYSRNLIIDAIRKGDLNYAESATERYLYFVREEPFGFRFGYRDHLEFRMYLLAKDGRKAALLETLKERIGLERDYSSLCSIFDPLFPGVLAPYRKDEDVLKLLRDADCQERVISKMDDVAKNGLREYKGPLLLPYHGAD
ncbi:hypothetical protein [Erythrobacter sp. F6033]|uniref:hypothetical protein n=1 Tax=Erythrobacter sp. F6033 TaxID=2926401 RepID=UPI001FF3CE82|nr:hypothetical protein [Erythrobacter sp. F6033]MCK0127497.1 hypothetical protein [Erythrobacter sp. F6033]